MVGKQRMSNKLKSLQIICVKITQIIISKGNYFPLSTTVVKVDSFQ